MSKPLSSIDPVDHATASEVVARRSETRGTAAKEVYGAESLPVLIRLPELSASAVGDAPMTVTPRSEVGAERDVAAETATSVAGEAADPRSRQPRRERRVGRERPTTEKARPGGWLGGVGQLAIAAVLAGILLVVIVTIKERYKPLPARKPTAGHERVEAPAIDAGQPALEPAQNMMSEQDDDSGLEPVTQDLPTLRGIAPVDVPPSAALPTDFSAARGGAAPPTVPTFIPRPTTFAAGTGYADAGPTTAVANGYPSTGVEPVASHPGAGGHVSNEGWRETVPLGAVRNADRSQADPRTQQR